MKSNKWLTMAAVAALSTTMAFAAPHGGKFGHGKHGKRGGEFGARFAQELNLSEAQKQQIRDLQKQFRENNKALFQSSRATREQMFEARKAGDTAKLEQLKAASATQREQMKQLRAAQRDRVLAILTPEQRAKFDALKAERDARRGERGHRGFGRKNG
jgi:protein CpxP